MILEEWRESPGYLNPEDQTVEANAGPAVSRPDDLWTLGSNRLLCTDARFTEAYSKLLGNKKADLVFTDPPYNVPIDGHVSGLGRVKHREFGMASGEMTEAEIHAVSRNNTKCCGQCFTRWRTALRVYGLAASS